MEIIKPLLDVAKDYGLAFAILIGIIAFLYKANFTLLAKLEEQYKGQIDQLAAENREYRKIFLVKLAGLTEKEWQKIQPPHELEKKEEVKK